MKLINKEKLFLFIILVLGFFLRFYRLTELAIFVGDQGRDYLVARDFLINHKVILVGPQTSVPWLYLGPFFYYFLALFLKIGNFNPISPAYGTAFFGVLAVYLIFVLGKKLFDEKAGLIAAFFYAISPYAVLQSRISLHPSILPVFEILFLIYLVKILKEKTCSPVYYLLFTIYFLVSIQLHFSAILLIPITLISWERIKFPRSTKLLRLFLGAVVFLTLVKIFRNSPFTPISHWWQMFGEIFSYRNIFGSILALIFVVFGVIHLGKAKESGGKILLISLFVIICGLTIKNSPAEHPYNLFLPIIILFFSYGLAQLSIKRSGNIINLVVCALFLISNSYDLMTTNYFSKIYGPGLSSRIKLAEFIVNDSGGSQFTLKRCGPLWDYPSTNKNYEYFVWWLGRQSKRQSGRGEIIYYILEPAGSWEGCKKVLGEVFMFDFAEVVKVKNDI